MNTLNETDKARFNKLMARREQIEWSLSKMLANKSDKNSTSRLTDLQKNPYHIPIPLIPPYNVSISAWNGFNNLPQPPTRNATTRNTTTRNTTTYNNNKNISISSWNGYNNGDTYRPGVTQSPPRTIICLHRGMEYAHNHQEKDQTSQNSNSSSKYIYVGVLVLFLLVFFVVKTIIASRRKLRFPRPRLITGEIMEIDQPSAHSNHQLFLEAAEEYRINNNPLYDNGRNPPLITTIAIPRRFLFQGRGNGAGHVEDHSRRNSSSTIQSSSSSNCQTISNRQTDSGRRPGLTMRSDFPPSYSELETVVVDKELEAPPPSYYEVQANLKLNP